MFTTVCRFCFVNFSNEESYVAIREFKLMRASTKAFAGKETKWEAYTEKALEHEHEGAPAIVRQQENQEKRRRKSIYSRQISSDSSEDSKPSWKKGNFI